MMICRHGLGKCGAWLLAACIVGPAAAATAAPPSPFNYGVSAWGSRGLHRVETARGAGAGALSVLALGSLERTSGVLLSRDHDLAYRALLGLHWAPFRHLETGLTVEYRGHRYSGIGQLQQQQLGNPALRLKVHAAPLAGWSLGALVLVQVPTSPTASGLVARGLQAEAQLLASWQPAARIALALNAGYRLDHSHRLYPQTASPLQRLIGEINDFNAVLASLGAEGNLSPWGVPMAPFIEASGRIYPQLSARAYPLRTSLGLSLWPWPDGPLVIKVGIDLRLRGAPMAVQPPRLASLPAWEAFLQVGLRVRAGQDLPALGDSCVAAEECSAGQTCQNGRCILLERHRIQHQLGTYLVVGQVKDQATGQPITGAAICIGQDPCVSTDASGIFRSGIQPERPAGSPLQVLSLRAAGYKNVSAVVPLGRANSQVALQLQLSADARVQLGHLQIVLTDEISQMPLRNARLALPGGGAQGTQIGPGVYILDLPPGRHSIVISAPGHVSRVLHLTLEDAVTTRLSAQLEPWRGRGQRRR